MKDWFFNKKSAVTRVILEKEINTFLPDFSLTGIDEIDERYKSVKNNKFL